MQILNPGDAIRAREMLNLSQTKVARDVGLNRSYLSQFEGGKRILEDRWQSALRDYYLSMGWDEFEDDQMARSGSTAASSLEPVTIRDGFVIADPAAQGDLEGLLGEYYDSSHQIEELGQVQLQRGLFGGLDEADALWQARRYLALAARQNAILRIIRGQPRTECRPEFDAGDFSTVTTVEEYVDHLTGSLLQGGASVRQGAE